MESAQSSKGGLGLLVDRLSALAERLATVPLGEELAQLAEELRCEAEALRVGASSELLQALSRAREEREERAGEGRRDDEGKEGERRNWRPLRLALAQHSAFCAERELELRLELEQLQDAKAQDVQEPAASSNLDAQIQEAVQQQLRVALDEEARAARRARQNLVEENQLLRTQLRSARQRQHCLEVENGALKTMLSCFEALGPPPSSSQGAASDGFPESPAGEAPDPDLEESDMSGNNQQEPLVPRSSSVTRKKVSRKVAGRAKPKAGRAHGHAFPSMTSRLRRMSESHVFDINDWKTRMADLQGIMSAAKALFLLLETHHEAIVRVALELALEPEVMRIFAWENWYQESQRRESFRKKVQEKLQRVFRMLEVHVDSASVLAQVSSVGSNLDVSDLHVSSWRDDFQQESPCGLLIRKPPDRRLHQKHVRRLDRFLTEVREDPTVLLKRVSERRGSTSLEADSAGDLDVVSV
eukprot:g754.t1